MTKFEKAMNAVLELMDIEKAIASPTIADGRKSDYERQAIANETGKPVCFQGLWTKGKYPVKRLVIPMPIAGGVAFVRTGGCAVNVETYICRKRGK